MEADVYYLPVPKQLTSQQRSHWEQQLENADRARLFALRMLGKLPIEQELQENTDA